MNFKTSKSALGYAATVLFPGTGATFATDSESVLHSIQSEIKKFHRDFHLRASPICTIDQYMIPTCTQSELQNQIVVAYDKAFEFGNSPLDAAIFNSNSLLAYEDDWDENGAEATDEVTLKKAHNLLRKYSKALFTKTMAVPGIDIGRDGSIILEWRNQGARLTLLIKKGESNIAYYYGVSRKGIPLKSGVALEGNLDKTLLSWIEENLSFDYARISFFKR